MTLPDLISKLETAEGGSRELDAALLIAFHPRFAEWPRTDHGGWMSPEWGLIAPAPAYTTCVDAALALIGERLPGAYGRIEPRFYEPEDVRWIGYTIRPHWDRWSPVSDDWFDVSEARAATPAIALCLALCRALQSQDTPND